jgi:pimeloyl-ACP methyl ester carboxylesterase
MRTLGEAAARSHWEDWERISCPSLVVRAGNGPIAPADAQAMAVRGQYARLVELAGAEHDLHLDRPAEWRQVLSEFVSSLGTAAA